jgi:hypothetical protein
VMLAIGLPLMRLLPKYEPFMALVKKINAR